jgi:Family of unknown function (DUF5682)
MGRTRYRCGEAPFPHFLTCTARRIIDYLSERHVRTLLDHNRLVIQRLKTTRSVEDGIPTRSMGTSGELSAPVFVEMMPLLRRAFADFTAPERRQMGNKVKHLGSGSGESPVAPLSAGETTNIDHERASRVLPILAHILGPK